MNKLIINYCGMRITNGSRSGSKPCPWSWSRSWSRSKSGSRSGSWTWVWSGSWSRARFGSRAWSWPTARINFRELK